MKIEDGNGTGSRVDYMLVKRVLLDAIERIEMSECWWLSDPENGGMDVKSLERALSEVEKEVPPHFENYIHGEFKPPERNERRHYWDIAKKFMSEHGPKGKKGDAG